DRGPRSALADRDHGAVARELVGPDADEPVRDVDAAGDVAGVAFVELAHVDELDGVALEQAAELVDGDRLHRLLRRGLGEVAGEVEEADRTQAPRGPLG